MSLQWRAILILLTYFGSTVPILDHSGSRFLPSAERADSRDTAQAPEVATPPAGPGEVAYLIALDKNGRPVTDLKQDEFGVLENKVEQKVSSVLPVGNEPVTIGLFFDISGSRHADSHVSEETRLASAFLRSIWQNGSSAFLVAFNQKSIVVTQPTQKLEEIDQGLEQIPGGYWGSTALYDALCIVKPEKLNVVPGRKIYVVFSDFEDNSSRNKLENVVDIAHEGRVAIFPVILGEGFVGGHSKRLEKLGKRNAQAMSDKTGGEVLIPESPKELAAALERLASEVRATYRLCYTPSSLAADRQKRKVKIETTRPQVKLLFAKN